MEKQLPTYGGQAVIEGVMMRGARSCAVAVRAPDRSIVVKSRPLGRLYSSRLARTPFVRGVFLLWDALVLGIQALTFAADVQAGEDRKIEGAPMAAALIIGLAGGVGLFILLPAGVAYLAERYLGLTPWAAYLLEGLVRLGLLVGYVWAIGLWPEVSRVYAYHGAEHKTINAFEAGAPLTVEQVSKYPREHNRCGTAFLLNVVILSILLFALLGPMPFLPRMVSRLLLVPLLASLAFECLRLAARAGHRPWVRALMTPNLALQRLTTREPEADMIEVALAAFHAMREGEASVGSPAASSPG